MVLIDGLTRMEHRAGKICLTDKDGQLCEASFEFMPHDILILSDIIPFAGNLIDKVNELKLWEPSTIYEEGGILKVNENVRNNTRITLSGETHKDLEDYTLAMKTIMHNAYRLYALDNEYIRAGRDEGYQLLRYTKDQHYRVHADSGPGATTRCVSAIAYLNDDFEGGELYFPRQKILIKPKARSIIIFPSFYTHVHEAKDILSGIKYSVVTWFHTV